MIDARGYYAQLGVSSSATAAEIRRAFYAKAKALHPDAGEPGDSAAFQAVCDAYRILGNARLRATYDEAIEWIARDDDRAPSRRPLSAWRLALGVVLVTACAVLLATAYLAGVPGHSPPSARAYESAEPAGPPALSRFDAEADAAVAETLKKPPPPEDYAKSRSR